MSQCRAYVRGLVNGASIPTLARAHTTPRYPLVHRYDLFELQRTRSVQVELRNTASVRLRLAIHTCCGTGRNFLFGGE